MSTNHHTAIANGAAANAATINGPLGQLDSKITDLNTILTSPTWIDGLMLLWNSGTSVTVKVGRCFAENGDFINVTSDLVKSSLSLSVSTWYHIYVYLSGGVAAAEVVTTAPVAWKGNAYSKTGDTSRRYVGSIKSDGSGNVIKFIHIPSVNQILYMKFQLNASPFRVLSAGTASTATAVSLTTMIPVTAAVAYIRLTSTADQTLHSSDDNGVGVSQMTVTLQSGTTIAQSIELFHPIDGSQQIWYKYAAAVGAGSLSIDIAGYIFNR